MGSVVALSNTSGTIVETYSRACPSMFLTGDAFGNTTVCEDDGTPRTPNASLYANPYMYTARRYDSETSLYYYRARIYSPTLGRFLQPDPIGYADGMNMYAYCGNNAVNFIDPWGLWGVGGELRGASHQAITAKALENRALAEYVSSSDKKFLTYYASIGADVRIGHAFKENTYHHSTGLSKWTATETRGKMLKQAEAWYIYGGLAGLGRLAHMVQDSYCPSHTERNSNGQITAFLDYYLQNKRQHALLDNAFTETGGLTPEALQAAKATEYLFLLHEGGLSWETVEKFLLDIWDLSEDAKIYIGKEFKK